MKGPTMRTSRTRSHVQVVGALATGLLLAGCAAMPSTGEPPSQSVAGGNTQAAQQVVVFAEPPKAADPPIQLFSSFLDDLVSDEQGYQTAKEFLTPEAAKAWNPQSQAAVLERVNASLDGEATATRAKIEVSGTLVATLNARHAYVPAHNTSYHQEFTLVKGSQGWRIDTPPDGIILNAVDFARIYEAVDLYFPVAGSGGTGSFNSSPSPLVADPIYVRSHIDPLTDAADALLGGPSDWLAPAVSSGFPKGSSLGRGPVDIGTDTGDNAVRIQLGGVAGARLANQADCDRMAAQLYFTLSEVPTQQAPQAGQKIGSVSLSQKGDDSIACAASSDSSYSPFSAQSGTTSYFVDPTGHLDSLDVGLGDPASKPVTGALMPPGGGHIGGFAVAPGGSGNVAVLSSNQRDLYVSTLTRQTPPVRPTLTSAVNGGLTTPSWDSLGRLWVADTDPAHPTVQAVVDNKVVDVAVEGLQGTVTGVRVAADGARIALTVTSDNADNPVQSVQVGRIEQTGTANAPVLTVDRLLSVTPASLTSAKSVSWLDGDSLIVLGQSVGTAPGLSTWEVDGSSALAAAGTLPSPADGMTTVAALPQDSSQENGVKAPLLGDSNGSSETGNTADKGTGKIYRWNKNQWQEVAKGDPTGNGPMPSYPG
jgi:hypothetical protein